MKTKKRPNEGIFLFVIFIIAHGLSFSQEQPKLSLLHQDWREENPLNLEEKTELTQRFMTVRKSLPRDFDQYNPDDETVRALARLLWSDRTAVVDSSAQVDEIPIEPDTIAGYHSLKIDESNWKGGASILYTFRLDTNRVESSLETPAYLHPRTFKDVISVNIYVGPNQTTEDLLVASIKADMTSRMLGVPLCIPYYQLKHGPGDVCLVLFSCDSDPDSVLFSDQTVEMYRGNVRVTLRSSYKNFGCMDLAYRLDAYLIEQFEKAKQEREAKTETP